MSRRDIQQHALVEIERKQTMSGSSPARRSIQSPERHRYGGYLSEERNNLNSHHDALTASKEEHDRVRDHAIRALEKHVFKLEQLRIQDEEENILEKQKREKERLERELRLREEEQRLRELEAQKIPKLPPKLAVETTPAAANTNTTATNGIVKSPQTDANAGILPQAALVSAKPTSKDLSAAERTTGTTPSSNKPDSRQETDNMPRPSPFSTAPPASVSPVPNPFAAAQKPTANPFGQPAAVKPANVFATSAPVAPGTTSIQVAAPVQATPDRYLQIHQSLKKLRAMVKQQMTTNLELKKHVGNMRREIRKSIGQLTGEKGANRQQVCLQAYETFHLH